MTRLITPSETNRGAGNTGREVERESVVTDNHLRTEPGAEITRKREGQNRIRVQPNQRLPNRHAASGSTRRDPDRVWGKAKTNDRLRGERGVRKVGEGKYRTTRKHRVVARHESFKSKGGVNKEPKDGY